LKIKIYDDGLEPPYIVTPKNVLMLDMRRLCRVLEKLGILEKVFSEYLGEEVDEVEC